MSDRPRSHQGKGVYDPVLKNYYVPDDEPRMDPRGRHRMPDARKWMRFVIRSRQNVEADFLDYEGKSYDWNGELMYRWLPKSESVVADLKKEYRK